MIINKTVYVSLEELRFFELAELICIYVWFIVTHVVNTGIGETYYGKCNGTAYFNIMLWIWREKK